MNLIILEDDQNVASHIYSVAEGLGHDVILVTACADAALKAAVKHNPDLLIADVNLGGDSDGVEAAIAIREMTTTRCVFITGFGTHEVRHRAQEAWPLAFLTKPFSNCALEIALTTAMNVLSDGMARSLLQ